MKKSPLNKKQVSPRKREQKSFQPATSPEVQKIISIKDRFRKNIELPIQNMQAIERSKTPQRCLVHNTMLTLYCEIDRKALCANCMYQEDTHRKHRVIPIGRAINLIKEDINSYEIKLQGNLKQCSSLSQKLKQTIVKNENYYPRVISQLKIFYKNMMEMLKQKQKQQISQIEEQHQKIKNQIIFLEHQVKRIAGFIANQLKPLKKSQTEDLLLARRGTLQVLTKVNKTINQQLLDIFENDQSPNLIDFTLYNDIFQIVRNRLIVVLPGISVKPRKICCKTSTYTNQYLNRKASPQFNTNDNIRERSRPKSVSNKKGRKQVKFAIE